MLDNKYSKIYYKIIHNRINNPIQTEYVELHHILPKSLGGSDSPSNLVFLLAREHFICHYLLTKCFTVGTKSWYSMMLAFNFMSSNPHQSSQRYINSRLYKRFREQFAQVMSISQSGSNNSSFGTIWMTNLEFEKNIKVNSADIIHYQTLGYSRGRIMNFTK